MRNIRSLAGLLRFARNDEKCVKTYGPWYYTNASAGDFGSPLTLSLSRKGRGDAISTGTARPFVRIRLWMRLLWSRKYAKACMLGESRGEGVHSR